MSKYSKITDIPLIVLSTIEPYFKEKNKNFERVEAENHYVFFKGLGINNNCFFSIDDHEIKSDKLSLLISYQPCSNLNPDKFQRWLNPEQLKQHFNQWIQLLKQYENMSQVFQTNSNENRFTYEFFQEFEFVNDEEELLNANEIIKLDNTFETLKEKLLEYKETFLLEAYNEIQEEIDKTQKELTTISKKGLAYKISKIQALIFKQGPKFLKETGIEIVKAVIVEVIKNKLLN